MQQRINDLEAQLAAATGVATLNTQNTQNIQKLKHPQPEKFSGGTIEPSVLNWVDQVDAYLKHLVTKRP